MNRFRNALGSWVFILLTLTGGLALAAGGGAGPLLKKPDDWFRGPEARRIAANVISYQSGPGGWPKNTSTVDSNFQGDPRSLKPTFDNGSTTDELRFLARMRVATNDVLYQEPFMKGLGYVLTAQYPNGGWPQYYPPSKKYHRHITFNDGAMVRLMEFLREVATSDLYQFVPGDKRREAGGAFEKGIDCILKCQIQIGGKPTVWCAQHDEVDFSPRQGRAYELAAFSGAESVAITRLLMSVERSPRIVEAVEGAVAWFEASKLTGMRVVDKTGPDFKNERDRVVIEDSSAPPLWARFYDLKTGKPIFVDRDGVPKPSISEIGYERRNHYAWYGNWPAMLLSKDYPRWKGL